MFSLPMLIRFGPWVVAGFCILLLPTIYLVGSWKGYDNGYASKEAEIFAADLVAEQRRNSDDEEIRGMSDYELCVDALRSRGMSDEACGRLRGVHSEQPESSRDGGADPS